MRHWTIKFSTGEYLEESYLIFLNLRLTSSSSSSSLQDHKDKVEISEIIDIFTSEDTEDTPLESRI